MENRTHAIIAICFLLVLAIGAAVIVYWLSSSPIEPMAYRIVTSESVAGLSPHSRVEFKGLGVGHVRSIHFDAADPSRVVIDIGVHRGTYVTHATYAVLATHGLTGGVTLDLKLGAGSAEPLTTSASHPALIPLHKGLLAELEASARQNLDALHAVLANVNKVLDADNRTHLAASIRQMDAATAKLVELETSLAPALQHMPALMQSVQGNLAASRALLANVDKLVKDAQGPVHKLGEVADTAQRVGRTLDRQTTPEIDVLSQSLLRTSHELEELIRQLKASPQSLIFGPAKPAPGPGEPGFKLNGQQEGTHGQD